MNIREKAVNGVVWNLGERFGVQGIKFLMFIILARLLSPGDFGLFGIIGVFLLLTEVFVDSGFGLAYIQKENVNDIDANTVFFSNIFISVLLYFILWLASPFIASFYSEPSLLYLLRVVGVIIIINATIIIQSSQLVRNINFKRKAIITTWAVVISGIIGILAALNHLGVWSLVFQAISQSLILSVGFWVYNSWRPSLIFSRSSFDELFSFGGWMLGARLLTTIFDNIYILTIGKLFTTSKLGFYTQSIKIQQLLSNNLINTVSAVFFPIMRQYQNNPNKLRNGLEKYLTHTLFVITPILLILFINAKQLVLLILTEKWLPMAPYLQLLCILGIMAPIHMGNIQVLMVQGFSKINFKLTVIKGVLQIFNIFISYRWGILFIIYGQIIISIIALFINTYFTKIKINFGFMEQIKLLSPLIFSTMVTFIVGTFIHKTIDGELLALIISVTSIVFSFYIMLYIFNKKLMLQFVDLIKGLKSPSSF